MATDHPAESRPAGCAAIIVAAGQGLRLGGELPKQFLPLAGTPVLAHSFHALRAHRAIDTVVVVIGEGQEELARAALGPEAILVTGGATRRESVRAGLEALAARGHCDRVLVHDAARPLLPAAVIDRLVDALQRHDAAVPVLPVVDTLARADGAAIGDTVDRTALARVQTPQAFRFALALRAHRDWDSAEEPTDDAMMVRSLGTEVAMVEGDPSLDKITHAADFTRAQALAGPPATESRTGIGFDVHRFAPDKDLWLCGVKIDHPIGLAGHSDADVALHALVDALLGALAEGDIGDHFPPSDPQWKGAASHLFLGFARDRVSARGGRIIHVDVTLICEAPKIGPHRAAMRARLAELLEISLDRISVKATTTERLGFAGRSEGIAVQAVATLCLPAL